jgi:superfamily II DNA or RNA helicase
MGLPGNRPGRYNRGMDQPIRLTFDRGTILAADAPAELLAVLPGVQLDPRTGGYRARGIHYRAIVEHILRQKLLYKDDARSYQQTPWKIRNPHQPFRHQTEAVAAWWQGRGRGVVVLPTGTGKTYVALLAIEKAARPTLVVVPTIDLMNQWFDVLTAAFGGPVGQFGGGTQELQPLTVTTYQSAWAHVEQWGHRYGLIVFDECHHLPGPSYLEAATGSIAPFRLGLTATPERADGQEALLPELIGPIVYRREIKELAGFILARYQVQKCWVDLTPEEYERYQQARQVYRDFVESRGIGMSGRNGWQRFIQESCRSPAGRAAFQAYREQRRLALAAPAKIDLLQSLLERHRGDRVLIFTADNATVYQIARRFLVPAITYQTKTKERKKILERFHCGEYAILVTGQVLDEGVDVPAANVGIVLAGSGSTRQHVQRLGRLLRKHGDKEALLYEVVTRGTVEEFTSDRRRQHHAYQ